MVMIMTAKKVVDMEMLRVDQTRRWQDYMVTCKLRAITTHS